MVEFKDESEMREALEKMGMQLVIKFQNKNGDDIDYLVQKMEGTRVNYYNDNLQ